MFWKGSPQLDEITAHRDMDGIIRRQIMFDNIRRGRIMALLTIIFELIFIVVTTLALIAKVRNEFHYVYYIILYLLMVLVNAAFLLMARRMKPMAEYTGHELKRMENLLTGYLVFIMTWGSLVSLLDQALYGQVMVYIVNVVTCSVVFIIQARRLLLGYILSGTLIAAGLPFFQQSGDILLGHYVNLSVFLAVSWLASRLLYQTFWRNQAGRLALERANRMLADEIECNKKINEKLSQANFQLRHLSLVDELTGLANRRGLRNFITQAFEQQDVQINRLSAMMIDIDHFKQYNDRYGHAAGDQVLVSIAGILTAMVRCPLDLAVRWGGEEYVYLSFQSDAAQIREMAELVRQRTESLDILHETAPDYDHITISIGTSSMPIDSQAETSQIINSADQAMYAAKAAGRNCVQYWAADIE